MSNPYLPTHGCPWGTLFQVTTISADDLQAPQIALAATCIETDTHDQQATFQYALDFIDTIVVTGMPESAVLTWAILRSDDDDVSELPLTFHKHEGGGGGGDADGAADGGFWRWRSSPWMLYVRGLAVALKLRFATPGQHHNVLVYGGLADCEEVKGVDTPTYLDRATLTAPDIKQHVKDQYAAGPFFPPEVAPEDVIVVGPLRIGVGGSNSDIGIVDTIPFFGSQIQWRADAGPFTLLFDSFPRLKITPFVTTCVVGGVLGTHDPDTDTCCLDIGMGNLSRIADVSVRRES